jgi:hypothetical protein
METAILVVSLGVLPVFAGLILWRTVRACMSDGEELSFPDAEEDIYELLIECEIRELQRELLHDDLECGVLPNYWANQDRPRNFHAKGKQQ